MGRHADESSGSASAVGASDLDTVVLARPSAQLVLARPRARPGTEVALWREVEEILRPHLPLHRRRSPLVALLTAVRWRWPLALAAVVALLATPLAVTLGMTGGPAARDRAGAASAGEALPAPADDGGPSRSDVTASRSGPREPAADTAPTVPAAPLPPSSGATPPASADTTAPAAPAATASAAPTEGLVPLLAPGACTALYTPLLHWDGGYSGTLAVRNDTGAPLDGWTLGWPVAGDVDSVWGGTVSQTEDAVQVVDAGWNRTVPVGGTLRVEFMVTGAEQAPPAAVTLNEVSCRVTGSASPAPAPGG